MHVGTNERVLFAVAFAVTSLMLPMNVVDAEAFDIQSETLLRAPSAWNGVPYRAYPEGAPELTVLRITVPAHGELKWHKHPMPNAAYIISGEITVEEPTGRREHFSAGQVIPETVNAWHHGVVGDIPAVFVIFYAGVKEMPLSIRQP
jgi:quercetin dioxygenase-like cupin family protein